MGSIDTNDMSDGDESEPNKPATRSRGKKAATSKSGATNNRRKAEDTPVKTPANKRSKANSGAVQEIEKYDDEDEDEGMSPPEVDANGRKMTDEEKRKNFLERNR
jgi:ATF/CREB family transcription factor